MQDNISKSLEKWITNFLRNKDIFTKDIEKIEKKEDKLIVTFKTKKQIFLIRPFIDKIENIINYIDKSEDFVSLVIFNTKENFDIITKNWDQLIKNPKFSIYFVNPFSKTEKKWIIHPRTHDMISEKEVLIPGLLSLFNTVDVSTKEEIKKILK